MLEMHEKIGIKTAESDFDNNYNSYESRWLWPQGDEGNISMSIPLICIHAPSSTA